MAGAETTGRKPRGARQHGQTEVARPAAERLVYTVPEAACLLGLSRNGAYEAAKRGDIPTIRVGRLLLVPKIPLHRILGITTGAALVSRITGNFGAEHGGTEQADEES